MSYDDDDDDNTNVQNDARVNGAHRRPVNMVSVY